MGRLRIPRAATPGRGLPAVARRRLGGALTFAIALTASAAFAQPGGLDVVPAPAQVSPSADPGLELGEGTPIVVPAGDAGALRTARYLADVVHRTRGLSLPVITGSAPANRPAVMLDRSGPSGEAYRLRTDVSGATISAKDDAGLFYGAITLWQLAGPGRGAATIPSGQIDDAPRFAWRGLMIDSARHFQPPAEIKKIIDAMAALKLNTLHWHLTDDQGWRLEIRKYPKLTSVGAWRTPEKGSPDGTKRYGGFYTQAQVREVVAYAAARHVTIVPEIEMPGHATSALLAYPQFGSGAAPSAADQVLWGITPYVYGVDDRSVGFLEDVLTEVMALFPGRYIHVGGDEAERERWNASPAAQARLKALGSEDPAALQADFTQRIGKFLQAHGRTLVGWDEILGGGALPADAVVTSWHGIAGGLAAAAKGHDAVMSPAPIYYFDNRQGLGAAEPPGRGWLVRLADVYAFEPIPGSMSAQAARHILGVQGNLWTEHVRTASDLEAMAFPRAAAIAETGWTPAARKDWGSFFQRVPAELARERALGLRPDVAAVSVLATVAPMTKTGPEVVTLAAQRGGEIRYTTDGTEPRATSTAYSAPLPATGPIHAALFLDGARIGPTTTWTPAALRVRRSQELKLCNDKLGLNLEGAPGPVRRTFLINSADPCWTWPAADLTGMGQVTVAFERIPFNLAMDPAHNVVTVHPPRRPGGEFEVREDSCLSDPIAVGSVPPGPPGARSVLTLRLPPRTGRHDLCFSFTGMTFDPVKALERVELGPAP